MRFRIVSHSDTVFDDQDFQHKGLEAHPLKGGQRALVSSRKRRRSKSWRLTFRFEGTDVVLLDYLNYH